MGCKKKILQNCRWIILRIIHVDVFTTSIWFPSRREIFKITQRDIKVKPTCIQYTLYFLLYTTRVYNITWTIRVMSSSLWSDWANPKLMWLLNSRKLQNYKRSNGSRINRNWNPVTQSFFSRIFVSNFKSHG